MEGDQPGQVARDAVAALIGLSSVSATTQEGAELRVDPQSVNGLVIRALVPRLSLVGVQTVKLRWSVAGKPWVADAVLDDAEFHSTEQAIAVLRVEAAEPADLGREAARAELHAAGLLRAVQCVNAVPGNEYQVRIDDVSETGADLERVRGHPQRRVRARVRRAGTPVAPRGAGGRRAHGCRRHLRDRRTDHRLRAGRSADAARAGRRDRLTSARASGEVQIRGHCGQHGEHDDGQHRHPMPLRPLGSPWIGLMLTYWS